MDSEGYFLLNTGARIPGVGLGTWSATDGEGKKAVALALEVGYRSIDCAHLYGNEVEVGEALTEALQGKLPGLKREDLFVTSKLWFTSSTPKRVAQACKRSLKNLGLEYLDLFLVHWPLPAPLGDATDPPTLKQERLKQQLDVRATWGAMEDILASGMVKAIGVSNFSIQQIEELLSYAKVIPAVNQVELHPLWRQDALLQYCRGKGIHVSAHTPLGIPGVGRSPLNSVNSREEVEGWGANVPQGKGKSKSVHAPMLRHSILQEIADKYGKTSAQVILRWSLQRGTSVLPMSDRSDRIRSNRDVLSWALAAEDWEKVNSFVPQIQLIDESHSYLHGRHLSLMEEEGNAEGGSHVGSGVLEEVEEEG